MELTSTEILMVEAQQKKIEVFRRMLMDTRSEQATSYLFKKLNSTRHFINHIKKYGFMREVA